MHKLKTILLCTTAAAVYGVVHDQITARLCIEYFTIGLWRARGRPRVLTLLPRTKWGLVRALFLAAAAVGAVWLRFFAC